MAWSLFEVIRIAYRGHVVSRTDADFRRLAGVSFETVRDRREDTATMKRIYEALNKECEEYFEPELRVFMENYAGASRACKGETIDWEGRKQIGSRKKFLRGLFRKLCNPYIPQVSIDTEAGNNLDDKRLFKLFYPDGIDGDFAIDPLMVMLITYNIIKPLNPDAQRSRDLTREELIASLNEMIALVEQLKEDFPKMTVTEKPGVFDMATDVLRAKLRCIDDAEERSQCTTVWFHFQLKNILTSCRNVTSPKNATESDTEITSFCMPGIWIDDADNGENRFWIFPENTHLAFCYCYDGSCWHLYPFEFVLPMENGELAGICAFISPEGECKALFGKERKIPDEEIGYAEYERCEVSESGLFNVIRFDFTDRTHKSRFNWTAFTRLKEDAPKLQAFLGVLRKIYDRGSVQSIFLFENHGKFFTDVVNALVGMDGDYLYVWDQREPDGHTLHMNHNGRFTYDYDYDNEMPSANFLQIEISEEHPLYAIPRRVLRDKEIGERERRFIEAAANTTIDDFIAIYRLPGKGRKMLCFTRFSLLELLDRELTVLKDIGVKRITSREELFGRS
ncbi:MAG: hypothetical protein K2K97_08260 [Muribaculaceae bacterium]|nr:hypothetical protein [Muribaculaceae bacterium]